MEELKPCPFCGETNAKNIFKQGLSGRYFIDHFDSIYWIKSSIGFDTEAEAIEAWNRRRNNATD